VGAPWRIRGWPVYRVDRRALALALVFFAVFVFAVVVAGRGDPFSPPRPSTLTPAPEAPAAPGGDRR
jgi:hypothetical protein